MSSDLEPKLVEPKKVYYQDDVENEVTFNCDIPSVTSWTLNGKALPVGVSTAESKNILIIKKVNLEHVGIYLCEGKNKDGKIVFGGARLSHDSMLIIISSQSN